MGKPRGSKRATAASRNAASDVSRPKRGKFTPKPLKSKKCPSAPNRTTVEPGEETPPSASSDGSAAHAGSGELDFASPTSLLASLLGPAASLSSFWETHWEQKPLVVHRGGARVGAGGGASTSCYGVSFLKEGLLSLLAKHNIRFGSDINVCRYVKSKRENLNGSGRATTSKIENLFDKKQATVQFHQPQRFQDKLWHICEMLETHFQSLVGANVYITPGGSQGLAPHYDDVEVFILQLEGRKHWRLYAPPTELPRDYSGDLSQDDIGPPTHDFVLETGDLLYFPRGTVHQADTPVDCSHSTHVTLSMYQRSSCCDLLTLALPNILDSAIHDSIDFRQGLKVGQLSNTKADDKAIFQRLLGQLSNHMEDHVDEAKYQMLSDFVANRLPPYRPGDLEVGPVGPMPTGKCTVRLTYPSHTFVHEASESEDGCGDDDDEDEDEADEDLTEADSPSDEHMCSPGRYVVVQHSVGNSRTDHMMGPGEAKPRALRFPASYRLAIDQLKSCPEGDWLESSRLGLPGDDVRNFLMSLWAEGLIEISKA